MTTRPTIIAGIGPSDEASDAVALGTALARAYGARLLLASVVVMIDGPGVVAAGRETRGAVQERVDAVAGAVAPDVDTETIAVVGRSPVLVLHRLAEREQALALVLGPTHLDAAALAERGGTALGALHGAPCPVAVAPAGYARRIPAPPRDLGVAWDGSAEADAALAAAVALAERDDGSVRILHAAQPATASEQTRRAAGSAVADQPDDLVRLRQAAAAAGLRVPVETVLVEEAAELGLIEATRDLELLVMGSRGHGPVKRRRWRSVSESLVRRSACPVLIVPRGARVAVS